MGITEEDKKYILRTFRLARKALGQTSPNPLVGAVLVKDSKIIAQDFHKKAGTPHAEALVIASAAEKAKGATLYVNLEPCCHTRKRTPPCTEAIIKAGIKRVVAAMSDPNPEVSGRGFRRLQEAGIEVVSGVYEDRARRLNEHYIKYITTGMPFVTVKVAMSLDGKIALPTGESKWITSEAARRKVQLLRAAADCIVTGAGTVIADDPELTVRIRGLPSPVRVVIDHELQIPLNARILNIPPRTIVVTSADRNTEKTKALMAKGVEVMFYEGELDFKWLMYELTKKGIISVMVEAGSTLPAYMLKQAVVDKVVFFIAPKIIGGKDSYPAIGGPSCGSLKEAYGLRDVRVRRVGKDIMVEGYLK